MLFPKANNWRVGMQDVSAAIDSTMGERVTVTPVATAKPNFRGMPEHSKAVTVVAVFTNRAKTVVMGESTGRISGGHSVSPLITTSEPIFTFGYDVLPFPIHQKYWIMRRCDSTIYEVTDVKPDGVSRIVCKVVQLGRPKEVK